MGGRAHSGGRGRAATGEPAPAPAPGPRRAAPGPRLLARGTAPALRRAAACQRPGRGDRADPASPGASPRPASCSRRSVSCPLSLLLINAVVDLLFRCASVAAQGPAVPGCNCFLVSRGNLTETCDSPFPQDSVLPSLPSTRLRWSPSPLHFTAWHLNGNSS